jgi:hypothetical protein
MKVRNVPHCIISVRGCKFNKKLRMIGWRLRLAFQSFKWYQYVIWNGLNGEKARLLNLVYFE